MKSRAGLVLMVGFLLIATTCSYGWGENQQESEEFSRMVDAAAKSYGSDLPTAESDAEAAYYFWIRKGKFVNFTSPLGNRTETPSIKARALYGFLCALAAKKGDLATARKYLEECRSLRFYKREGGDDKYRSNQDPTWPAGFSAEAIKSAPDELVKNPTVENLRAAIDLCLGVTGDTPEARAKSVDEALSRVRGVIRTKSDLDSATRGKLLGETWAAQGGYLESLGALDAAGDAFREAAREFKAAGARDKAEAADANADRCYEAQAGAKTPTGTGTGSGTGSSAGSGTGTSTDSPGTGGSTGTESSEPEPEPAKDPDQTGAAATDLGSLRRKALQAIAKDDSKMIEIAQAYVDAVRESDSGNYVDAQLVLSKAYDTQYRITRDSDLALKASEILGVLYRTRKVATHDQMGALKDALLKEIVAIATGEELPGTDPTGATADAGDSGPADTPNTDGTVAVEPTEPTTGGTGTGTGTGTDEPADPGEPTTPATKCKYYHTGSSCPACGWKKNP